MGGVDAEPREGDPELNQQWIKALAQGLIMMSSHILTHQSPSYLWDG